MNLGSSIIKHLNEAEEQGYNYTLKHGIGPGTLPDDVKVLEHREDGAKDIVKLNRVLTAEELNKYEISEGPVNENQDEKFLKDNGPLEEYQDPRPNETYIRNIIDEGILSDSDVLDEILRYLPDNELGKIIDGINNLARSEETEFDD